MRKFKLFIDYDKEEKWLNEMAKKGYQLEHVCFGYGFRYTKPENSTIRIDYRAFKKEIDFIDYCSLFEDSGWKHVAGSKNSGTQYFKKIDENSQEDIFSDDISKAGKYKRVSDVCAAVVASYLPICIVLISRGYINTKAIIDPKVLYFTPGLWKMTGIEFWRCFLFETPFVILRSFVWLIIPLAMILYVWLLIKARLFYIKQKRSNQNY